MTADAEFEARIASASRRLRRLQLLRRGLTAALLCSWALLGAELARSWLGVSFFWQGMLSAAALLGAIAMTFECLRAPLPPELVARVMDRICGGALIEAAQESGRSAPHHSPALCRAAVERWDERPLRARLPWRWPASSPLSIGLSLALALLCLSDPRLVTRRAAVLSAASQRPQLFGGEALASLDAAADGELVWAPALPGEAPTLADASPEEAMALGSHAPDAAASEGAEGAGTAPARSSPEAEAQGGVSGSGDGGRGGAVAGGDLAGSASHSSAGSSENDSQIPSKSVGTSAEARVLDEAGALRRRHRILDGWRARSAVTRYLSGDLEQRRR